MLAPSLKEGEIICPTCKGSGKEDLGDKDHYIPRNCSTCLGEGKLDWIEVIVGKKTLYNFCLDLDVNALYPHVFNFDKK